MARLTLYEFDVLTVAGTFVASWAGVHAVPPGVFAWLENRALQAAGSGEPAWLRLTQRNGQRAVQVTSFVGVIRAPDGYQIEVLPKLGRIPGSADSEVRQLLIRMLRCLNGFRHIRTDSAQLQATRMPLLEVFVGEFLRAVEKLVKQGLRSDYCAQQDNVFALRGKLQMSTHLRQNRCRRDRFFVEFDEFTPDRPENRLLHLALRRVLDWTAVPASQQAARELCFIFADVPLPHDPAMDFQRVRLDRGMVQYEAPLAWARLILADESPLTGMGGHQAPSLLFPMEAVFEAYVAKHLARQLRSGFSLHVQTRTMSLVRHMDQHWFQLRPDLLVQDGQGSRLVLDTKWKLINARQTTGTDKYGLDQADFYQLFAYGQNYLAGKGDLVLVYPGTADFSSPLPVFEFPGVFGLRLWVLPFCLQSRKLLLPECGGLDSFLVP